MLELGCRFHLQLTHFCLQFPEFLPCVIYFRNAINNETIRHLQRTGRGIQRNKTMTLGDLTNAVQTKTIDRSTQEVLQTAGL